LRTLPLPETNELFRRIQMGQVPVDLRESRLDDRSASAGKTPAPPPVGTGEGVEVGRGPLWPPAVESDPHNGHPQGTAVEDPTGGRPQGPPPHFHTAPAPTGVEETVDEAPRQLDLERILKAELVGREEEFARMQQIFEQAHNGQRRVIFASGEPGIGKSRLAHDFTKWAEDTQQATVLWGYCYEMSGSLPYQPIADAINAHARTCPPEKLRAMLGNSAVDLAKIAPEIAYKLPDLPQPESPGAEAERRNLYNAVARYFHMLATEGPFILILDDLQWADAATLHLLNFLTLQSQGAGMGSSEGTSNAGKGKSIPLYVLLYRPDEVHETHPMRGLIATLVRAGTGEEFRLQRLSEEEVHQLLVNMAGHEVQPVFAGEVYRQTEGNPFFVGEAVRSLILEGKIKWTGDRWQSTVKISELEIPHSVRMLIERRLVHLSPDCRTTLALAAVIGRQFSSSLLSQARNLPEDIVAEHIDNAIQLQIIDPLTDSGALLQGDPSREPIYRARGRPYQTDQDADLAFTHDKIREVLYQWLNPLRRRSLHRQVAQAIEASSAAHLQGYYSTLAYHYRMAEDTVRAVDYLLKASYQAMGVYAFADAAEDMKTALELLIGDGERARRAMLLHQLANIYLYTGRTDDAIQAGLASSTLWRDLGDAARQAATYLDVAFFCHWQGRELEAVKYIQSALQCLATRPEETTLLAKAYTQWGLAATVMGDVPAAREKLSRADELHTVVGGSAPVHPDSSSGFTEAERREHDAFIAVVSLWSRAWCAYLAETPEQMLAYALQGAEMCRSYSKPDWEPMMTYSAAWAHMMLGQIPVGEQVARNALERAQQHGVFGAAGWANLVLAFLAIQAGRWDDARQMADKASAIATMIQDSDLQARVLWSRSVCAGWLGDWEQAIAYALEALQVAKQEGETSMVYPYLLLQVARAYFHAGKPQEAQAYLNEGMQLGASRQYRELSGIAQRLQGRIWQAQGKFEEAGPCFEHSLAELLAIDDVVEYARTQEAYGLFYIERDLPGDMERGQELMQKAKETFQRLGVNG
jgi:predicted ATPase